MEIKQFIDTRFLVPPIITVFFIWLVDPFVFFDYFKNYEEKLKLDYIRKHIHKRWHACNANFNCVAALIASAAILLLYLNWSPSCAWWVIWIISIVLFVINGRYAYQDVKSIDILMVKRKKWLQNKY